MKKPKFEKLKELLENNEELTFYFLHFKISFQINIV